MKSLAIALALFGTSAQACPNLVGTYKLKMDKAYTEKMVITQSVSEFGTKYSVTIEDETSTWMADGLKRKQVKQDILGSSIIASETVSCVDDKLSLIYSEEVITTEGKSFVKVRGYQVYKIDDSNNLSVLDLMVDFSSDKSKQNILTYERQ